MIKGLDMACGSRDAEGEGRGEGLLFLMNMCFKLPVLLSLLLECLDHSPACSPHPSMQTAVFLCISCLLASSLLIHGSHTHGSHSDRLSCFLSFSAAPIEIYNEQRIRKKVLPPFSPFRETRYRHNTKFVLLVNKARMTLFHFTPSSTPSSHS